MSQDYQPVGPSSPPQSTQPTPPEESESPAAGKGRYLLWGCGGCAVIAIFGAIIGSWIVMSFGFGVFADEVETDLRTNPVIIEHLGRIEEFELDLGKSIAAEGDDDFVFRARGTKGSGLITVTCITNDDDIEEVVAGTVQLDTGETLDLFPEPNIQN